MSRFSNANRLPARNPTFLTQANRQVHHHPQAQAAPVAQPLNLYHPPPNPNDILIHRIMDSVTQTLNAHQGIMLLRLENLEQCFRHSIESLDTNVKRSENSIKTILEGDLALQKTIVDQRKTLKGLSSRVASLESVLGAHESSIVERLSAVDYSMAELLERARDPYAPIDPILKHDMATSPMRQTRSVSPIEPEPSSSSVNSLVIRANRGETAPKHGPNARSPHVSDSICTSPIRAVQTSHTYHENAAGPSSLGVKIPIWLRRPSTPEPRGTSSTNATSQFPRSTTTSFPLVSVDWTKSNINDDVQREESSISIPSVPFRGSIGNTSISTPTGFRRESHVPSSRTPSPVPTYNVNDQSPSTATGTSTEVNSAHSSISEGSSGAITTPTIPRTHSASESPSPSVIDEASVLQMIKFPDSSLPDSHLDHATLDTDLDKHQGDNTQVESSHRSVAPGLPSTPATTLGPLPLSGKRAILSSILDDELSDLTSLSESSSEHADRPRKRPRLSRQTKLTPEPQIKQENTPTRRRGRPPSKFGIFGSGFSSQSRKTKKKSKLSVVWPTKVLNQEGSCGTVIQCDLCQLWYHCGCVGFSADDPALETLDVFKCPLCIIGIPPLATPNEEEKCSRPDCTEKTEDDIFFVERIVGRKVKVGGTNGRQRLWLVKWLNYPINRATWEGDDSIGGNQKLIENFLDDLKAEGIPDDPSSTILLQEASRGGWNADEPDVAPPAE
ncbi:hypothetical protein F5878DRAFT_725920 [Lentinula raphanica]|uniref:Chromo domain-containing protein n=1 Tax=Lentinula raphanica TaxID=153919 RepID=A0AA38P7P7_9AGAR|nr:hypothetical protein F5878DRAFT_725920 [Lentinula raphanica]